MVVCGVPEFRYVAKEAAEENVIPCMPCESPEEREDREQAARRKREVSDIFYDNCPWEKQDKVEDPSHRKRIPSWSCPVNCCVARPVGRAD